MSPGPCPCPQVSPGVPGPYPSLRVHVPSPSLHVPPGVPRCPQVSPGVPSPSLRDPDERRQRFLERNRAAASRCRQKRKLWVSSLEKKAEELTSQNIQLSVSAARPCHGPAMGLAHGPFGESVPATPAADGDPPDCHPVTLGWHLLP
uniref:BZIP domain-containing protein n=1 Tax=Geospiza parvula TaxID=87175 RepID=A0A8C3QDQ1_GEOPR